MKLFILASILLSWIPVTQPKGVTVSYYNIYRSDNGGAYSLVKTGNTILNWKDTNTKARHRYCYEVQSVSTQGETSAMSKPYCIVAQGG